METDLFLSNQWSLEAYIKPYGNQQNTFQPNIVGFPMRHPNLELCGASGNAGCPDNPTKQITQLRDSNANYYTIVSTNPMGDTSTTWYHLSATWDGTDLFLYRDGGLQGNIRPKNMVPPYVAPLNCSFTLCDEGIDIGGFRFVDPNGNLWNGQYFNGVIDEIRVWNLARSSQDINTNMKNTLSGNELGLVYYWRFDEGQGLLTTSTALPGYGTLGGGIQAAQPLWVQSDSPLVNNFPAPSPPSGCPVAPPCNCDQAGTYVAGSILGILFIIIGMAVGICGYNKVSNRNYQQVK
jgi:hypothetical protein